jgi:dienelactone hydrolase
VTAALVTPTASAQPQLEGCVPKSATVVHLGGGTYTPLTAAVMGSGPRAVVFSNESDEDLCAWMPFAKRLVRDGFRVALYDYSGTGPLQDTVAVVAELRKLGASRVALVGASEGAKASIVAATKGGVAAVVSLSAERFLDGYGDIGSAARRLRAPVLYLYAKDDPLAEVNTPQLYRLTRERDRRLVGLPGMDHGTALLHHAGVPGMIEGFLRDRLSPRRSSVVVEAPPTLSSRCGGKSGGQTFWFKAADGAKLDGAVLGTGRTGVVLATEYPSELCQWLPEALVLSSRGLRVLLFDFRGLGLSPTPRHVRAQLDYVQDIVGAARELRRRGATRMYVMGASLGATASIVAAARIHPAVAGVVALSGEADLSGMFPGSDLDAVAAARRLNMPVLYMTAKADGLTPPADVARLRASLRSHGSRVVVFSGTYHGWDLLYHAPYRARAAALVLGFLR